MANAPMVLDWATISRYLEDVPLLVQHIVQFLIILALSGVAYALLRAWLERRSEAVGWDDRRLQAHCALARAIVLIAGLAVAAAGVGLFGAESTLRFFEAILIAIFRFVGTIVTAALWAVALGLAALAVGLVLGARDAVLGLVGGLILKSRRAGAEHLPRAGDQVQIGDARGTIDGFGLLKTRLKLEDGSLLLVSNAWVLDGQATILGAGAISE